MSAGCEWRNREPERFARVASWRAFAEAMGRRLGAILEAAPPGAAGTEAIAQAAAEFLAVSALCMTLALWETERPVSLRALALAEARRLIGPELAERAADAALGDGRLELTPDEFAGVAERLLALPPREGRPAFEVRVVVPAWERKGA